MRLCGIDIETTGLDHAADHVTEIAWVIKDPGDPKPLVMESRFILPPKEFWNSAEYIKPNIEQLTKIKMAHVMAGKEFLEVLGQLAADIQVYQVTHMVAHNGENFDKPFLQAKVALAGQSVEDQLGWLFKNIVWIDTAADAVYPADCRATNLLYLSAYYGFLNPFPHAALYDVASMLKILDYLDVAAVAERAKSPWCIVSADVGYDNRQLAKDRRYYWETFGSQTFPKTWVKKIKEMDLEKEKTEAPFKVHRIA